MNVAQALALVNAELRSRRPLAESMVRLARRVELASAIDFGADAEAFAISLGTLVGTLRPGVTGLCFFLDGDGGVDVLRCTSWTPHTDLEEWTETAKPAGKLRSAALGAAYREIAQNPVEYAICLGYLGLALRDAFREIGAAPVERGIVWGYHDGDMFLLGVHGPKGFRLTLAPEGKTEKKAASKARLPKLAAAPKASKRPRDWLVRAAVLSLTEGDSIVAANIAGQLAELGAKVDAAAIATSAAECAREKGPGVTSDMLVGRLAHCAEVLGRVGKRKEGIAVLEEACAMHPSLSEFWRDSTAYDLTDAAHALDALDVLRKHGVRARRFVEKPEVPPRSAKTILRLAEKELASDDADNAHGTFSTVLDLAEELHAQKEHAALAKVAAKANRTAERLGIRKGWVAACVLSDLAVLHAWLGDAARGEELLVNAERAAAAERKASNRETATLALRQAFDHVGQPDRPITMFRASRDSSREVRSAMRRGALHEVERLIADESTIETRVSMLMTAAEFLTADQ
jgi:hypothetical protein